MTASVSDIQGNAHELRLFAFALPDAPILFLLGLRDQRRLGFDICLRTGNDSHLKVSQWGSVHHRTVTSHFWLSFKPQPVSKMEHRDFKYLISSALSGSNSTYQSFVFTFSEPVNPAAPNPYVSPSTIFPILPCLREDWKSNLTPQHIPTLHKAVRHSERSALLKPTRQHSDFQSVPKDVISAIEILKYSECDKRRTLPRAPKLSLPPESHPNVTVSLDVLSHNVNHRSRDILVVLDHGDIFLRCGVLPNRTAVIAFQSYFTIWISYFDTPLFMTVDSGSNLASKDMHDTFSALQSQLCPIVTKAP